MVKKHRYLVYSSKITVKKLQQEHSYGCGHYSMRNYMKRAAASGGLSVTWTLECITLLADRTCSVTSSQKLLLP